MFRKQLCILIALAWVWPVQGAEAPAESDFTLKSLTLTAVPESAPILKHTLLHRTSEQQTGNAALFYYGAVGLMPDMDDELNEKFKQWRGQAVAELPRQEVDVFLASFAKSFHQIRLASLRERCEWEVPVEEGYGLELPSLAAFRQLTRALALKIRLDLADKHYNRALADIRHVLAMGRNIAAGPTLMQDLIGIYIAATAFRELTAWSKDAQTPNLYWALSILPTPFIDIRPSLEMEMDLMFREFRDLRVLDRETLSVEQANALAASILTKVGMNAEDNKTLRTLTPAAWAMMQYCDAQTFLQERQWSQAQIKALPVAQAVLLYQVQQYQDIRDEMVCWLFLPYGDAYPRLKEAERSLSNQYEKGFKANVFLYFMPALYRIGHLQCRLDRDIAMLRIVEALRLEAAHNGGHLPQALSDIKRVPIPADPLTGKPFIYDASDRRRARLEAPLHPEESHRRPVFDLTLQP